MLPDISPVKISQVKITEDTNLAGNGIPKNDAALK